MTIIDDQAANEEQDELDLSAPEIRAAGRWNSAATSRRIWILSASRACKWLISQAMVL
jgi:hypothetical protein